jgi:hypothetical protein
VARRPRRRSDHREATITVARITLKRSHALFFATSVIPSACARPASEPKSVESKCDRVTIVSFSRHTFRGSNERVGPQKIALKECGIELDVPTLGYGMDATPRRQTIGRDFARKGHFIPGRFGSEVIWEGSRAEWIEKVKAVRDRARAFGPRRSRQRVREGDRAVRGRQNRSPLRMSGGLARRDAATLR